MSFAASLEPTTRKPRSNRGGRPVRLHTNTALVWPGGRLRLRALVVSRGARAAAAKRAALKVRRGGSWRRVGTMRLRGGRYVYRPRLGHGRAAGRRFGGLRLKRGARVLRLRAYVRGTGRSNIVHVRIGR